MALSPHSVLVEVVAAADATGEPVSAAALAASLSVEEPAIDEILASLRECELIEATDCGYRPTVSARELLAMDIDLDDVLVVDVPEE